MQSLESPEKPHHNLNHVIRQSCKKAVPPYSTFRKVIEYRSASTRRMLCCHSKRAGPLNEYAERGSAGTFTRSHFPSTFLRKRSTHGVSSEIPTTCPNTALSRCHPIPAPGAYSVTSTCCNFSGSSSANEAARSRNGRRNSGMSSALRNAPPPENSYCQPNETTRLLPR